MTSFLSKIPTYRKIFHAVFNWRIARRVLLTLAVIGTLLAVIITEENWRGQRAWDTYKSDLVAQGVPMSFAQLQPPAIPDDQNFAMAPIIQSLGAVMSKASYKMEDKLSWRALVPGGDNQVPEWDYYLYSKPTELRAKMDELRKIIGQRDLVQAMNTAFPVLEEFTAASRRPAARFTIADDLSNYADMPVTVFLNLGKIYAVRALAELDQGQVQNSADDISTLYRLANLLSNGFTVTTQLVAIAMTGFADGPVREGLVEHRWSDAQLAQMQADMHKGDFIASLQKSFQYERIRLTQILERNTVSELVGSLQGMSRNSDLSWLAFATKLIPEGWVRLNQITYSQEHLKLVALLDPAHHKVDAPTLLAYQQDRARRSRTIFNFIGIIMTSNFAGMIQHGAVSLAQLDEAQVACAIERYWLANNKLPATLEELAPKFIAKIPNDVFNGGPMHYLPGADDHFQLYEVGLGGRDDGGKSDEKDGLGDIMWPDAGK